jgi:hypothetical protein
VAVCPQKINFFVSSNIIEECKAGDSDTASRRMAFLDGIPIIPDSEQIVVLATRYHELLGIPEKAKMDCFWLPV